MRPTRAPNPQALRQKILICCEGHDTEPNYLYGFKFGPRIRNDVNITIKGGHGGNANAVVKDAITERDKQVSSPAQYNKVWCVLDVEDRSRAKVLGEAIATAEQEGIRVFLSNPCFEVWLLAHFECKSGSFPNADAAEKYLRRTYWKPPFDAAYDKSRATTYGKSADLLDTALVNARRVLEQFHGGKLCRESNSSTEVYKLIQELLPPE